MKVPRFGKGTEETVEYKSENNSSYNWSARNNTKSVAKTGDGDWNNCQNIRIAKYCVGTFCQNPPEGTRDLKKLVVIKAVEDTFSDQKEEI